MKHVSLFPLRTFAVTTTVLALSAITSPALGKETRRQAKDACAAAASGSSTSATAAASTDSQHSIANTRTDRNGTASRECQDDRCGPSSTVTSGPGGLSGSTTLPGGSSVTLHSGAAVSGSSVATAGSSNSIDASTTAAGSGHGADCIVTVNPRAEQSKPNQHERTKEK